MKHDFLLPDNFSCCLSTNSLYIHLASKSFNHLHRTSPFSRNIWSFIIDSSLSLMVLFPVAPTPTTATDYNPSSYGSRSLEAFWTPWSLSTCLTFIPNIFSLKRILYNYADTLAPLHKWMLANVLAPSCLWGKNQRAIVVIIVIWLEKNQTWKERRLHLMHTYHISVQSHVIDNNINGNNFGTCHILKETWLRMTVIHLLI